MKKIFIMLLVGFVLMAGSISGVTPPIFAASSTGIYSMDSTSFSFKTYVVYGADEVISTATISTNNKIIGFIVAGNGAAAFCGLYDTDSVATTTTGASGTCIFEGAAASSQTEVVMFPFPKSITTALTVIVDASTTAVTILYI